VVLLRSLSHTTLTHTLSTSPRGRDWRSNFAAPRRARQDLNVTGNGLGAATSTSTSTSISTSSSPEDCVHEVPTYESVLALQRNADYVLCGCGGWVPIPPFPARERERESQKERGGFYGVSTTVYSSCCLASCSQLGWAGGETRVGWWRLLGCWLDELKQQLGELDR
jgi:hypothetical protein